MTLPAQGPGINIGSGRHPAELDDGRAAPLHLRQILTKDHDALEVVTDNA
jgi:hypothetical protein